MRAKTILATTAGAAFLALLGGAFAAASDQPGIVKTEFIYEQAPFPQCHASTIVEVKDGLVSAWFGGTKEKNPDVSIYLSRNTGGGWSAPQEVANGVQSPDLRYPCWNPVLFQPKNAPLMLFYKVGPSPSEWWGMTMLSEDGGKTWSKPTRLPDGILGPIKNKPIQLANGDLLSGSSTEHAGWRVHFERSSDLGKTWQLIGPVNDGKEFGAIQPTLLVHPGGKLQALCRSRQDRIAETWSSDGGKTWSKMQATSLPNPNAGLDAVTLADGQHLVVYNHTAREGEFPKSREMLNVAVSADGKNWKAALVLEKEEKCEFSYPAVIQTSDGRVHATYTWKRQRVKHVVIDPARLVLKDIVEGRR